VFYREAGSPDAPKLLLLHGFPTVRFFDTGHFALETHAAEIAAAILEFFPR
jgi:pimeloyl-ACP methyl ester carboxylesterase